MNKRQKKKQIKIRNKKLLKRYPFLLPKNVFTGKISKKYDYTYTEYDCLMKGWQIGFGEFWLEDLREALIKTNYMDKFRFMELKEKFGEFRQYCNPAPQEVYDVLHKYEFISGYVCCQCGSPHACIVDDYGWYLPLCKNCWDKNNKKREEERYRTTSWEDAVGEDIVGLPDEYKSITHSYFEGKIEITNIDISETANKIRKKFEKRKTLQR